MASNNLPVGAEALLNAGADPSGRVVHSHTPENALRGLGPDVYRMRTSVRVSPLVIDVRPYELRYYVLHTLG